MVVGGNKRGGILNHGTSHGLWIEERGEVSALSAKWIKLPRNVDPGTIETGTGWGGGARTSMVLRRVVAVSI